MIPPPVSQALQLAAECGFERSCADDVGRLLQVLVGHQPTGRIGEIGTGCGVGTAWMATSLQPGVALITVESNTNLATRVADLFRPLPAVRVIAGDWREILPHGPFALLFVDAADPKRDHPGELFEVMQPGGMIVLDDFTPIEAWPPTWYDRVDSVRDFWLHDPRLRSVELRVAPTMSVILAITSGRP